MKCPKCKGENKEDSIVCSGCGLKLKTACPRCKALNKLGQPVCSSCNLKLIRFCPQCKTPNFPNVTNCRKCNFEFPNTKKTAVQQPLPKQQAVEPEKLSEEKIPPEVPSQPNEAIISHQEIQIPEKEEQPKIIEVQQSPLSDESSVKQPKPAKTDLKELSRPEAHDKIVNTLKTYEHGLIINLTAPDGAGKSTLISSVTQSLREEKFIWLIGVCQPYSQLVSYSFFQDLFKTLFMLPLFVSNIDESKKALEKILETNLEIKDPHITNVLSRILFNDFAECSSDLFENRDEIQNGLIQVIETLNQKAKIAIIIEDFEYIDNASFEVIKKLLSGGFLDKNNFIIINNRLKQEEITKQFSIESLKKKVFSISLKSMSPEEFNSSLLGMLNNQDILPQKIKNTIFNLSKDTPLYMEQVLWFLFQTGALSSTETTLSFNPQAENIQLPPNIEELLKARINLLSNVSPDALRIIMSASLFGNKFIPSFVQVMSQVAEQPFNQLIQMLINNGIFVMADQYSIRFKHGWIWKIVYEQMFSDEQVVECGKRLLEIYEKYTANISSSILARHAEEANLKNETYNYCSLAAKESVYLGDSFTFTDYHAKVLDLLQETDLPDEEKTLIKRDIEEQIGKINVELNPHMAVEYLSNAVLFAEQQGDIVKVIDLTGYLARSCELSGNFSGVIECCEKALSLVDEKKYPLESLLLNYYKLESTFNMGRYEETAVISTNEILPALNKFISKNKTISGITLSDLINIEYETELILAKSLVFQGNKQALTLAENIAIKAQKENLSDFEVQALLLQALFMTVQGNIKGCNSILLDLNDKIPNTSTPDKFKLNWYFITIISNLMTGSFEKTREFCYSGITLANLFHEYNILTLIKLVLGKCIEMQGIPQNALLLYDEVVNYCSEHKMATGALFSWYLAADFEQKTGNPERAMEIAERALEISQKPNISNQLAEIFLHKLIAEIRTIKNDFEGAQINIETAIGIAEKNDLILCLVLLYITFAHIYRQSASVNSEKAADNANVANRLYLKAISFAEQIENHYIISSIETEISELLAFCKKSGIKLENV